MMLKCVLAHEPQTFDVPCDLLLPERPAQGTKERLVIFKYKETEAPMHPLLSFVLMVATVSY